MTAYLTDKKKMRKQIYDPIPTAARDELMPHDTHCREHDLLEDVYILTIWRSLGADSMRIEHLYQQQRSE